LRKIKYDKIIKKAIPVIFNLNSLAMNKLYHSISEVSSLIGEEQHILRYWEKEFEHLKPKKNRGGNRIYSDKDLQIIKLIKKFLRDDKLSLKGAKEQLARYITGQSDDNLFKFAQKSNGTYTEFYDKEKSEKSKNKISLEKSELVDIYNILKDVSAMLK
jgi:DNA-binding transcriptional MerR regulator